LIDGQEVTTHTEDNLRYQVEKVDDRHHYTVFQSVISCRRDTVERSKRVMHCEEGTVECNKEQNGMDCDNAMQNSMRQKCCGTSGEIIAYK
jgi:hypothetical protein